MVTHLPLIICPRIQQLSSWIFTWAPMMRRGFHRVVRYVSSRLKRSQRLMNCSVVLVDEWIRKCPLVWFIDLLLSCRVVVLWNRNSSLSSPGLFLWCSDERVKSCGGYWRPRSSRQQMSYWRPCLLEPGLHWREGALDNEVGGGGWMGGHEDQAKLGGVRRWMCLRAAAAATLRQLL